MPRAKPAEKEFPERDVVSSDLRDGQGRVAPPVMVKLWVLKLSCGHEEIRVAAKGKDAPTKVHCGSC
jgi:hypothetical protein